ncbi:HNH/ENDO VII family nuclease [Actinomyces sp. ICM58]|uniref:HNH/ENDO VII family nuclease n=1 Tax=Actinomyces sp. ICM58 TaxID=1105030 RepID=UPI0002771A21|nr:HNH/ENDO VII family nuclease [Actinomyces sp. ICM58]EJN52521.1 HNH/ENDO VII family nuclease [Actinomyces sp. ICM58]
MATDGTNPLVAQRQDTTSTLSGAGVFDDIEQLSEAIDNKSWVSGALAGVALGVDTVAYVSDPLATLMAWGIGWVFDHIQPFKDWLLQLAGDADQLRANGQTWKNVAATLKAAADNIERDVRSSFPDGSFTGSTATAYFAASGATTKGIAMTGALSGAVGTAYDVCAVIIQFVHDFVRDAISQVVASILSYAVELVASFGTAFPLVMEQISTKVASLMSGVSKRISALKESLSNLGTKLTNADQLLKSLKEWLHKLTHSDAPKADVDAPAAPKASADAPNPHTGDPAHNYGTFVDDDGIPHVDPSDPRPYLNPKNRPSFRKGIVDKVRDEFTDADGVLHDWRGKPVDWQPGQPRAGIWDMGHKPGHKYSDVWRSYVNGEMTPQQFLDWYNKPKNYRVEFSSRNRAHIDE